MNQPELGLKIAELRKAHGLTQQELSDKCNINIRTIQRIESGAVTPRVYSVRLILEALNLKYDDVFGDEEPQNIPASLGEKVKSFLFLNQDPEGSHITHGLLWAWIMGVVYFVAGFPEVALGTIAIESSLSPGEEALFIITKVVVVVSFFIFMRGFVILGKTTGLPLLSMVSTILMFVIAGFYFVEIAVYLAGYNIFGVVVAEGMCVGVLKIVFGYCLFKSEREFGRMGVAAGALEIVAGITFVTVVLGFIGLFMLIPIEILEIIILVRFYMKRLDFSIKKAASQVQH